LTRPWKVLCLLIVAVAALAILPGAESSTSSEGANNYLIDGTSGHKWTDFGATITLGDLDTLTLKASAGNPSGPKLIQIAADANVTINGDPTCFFLNVRISESSADTIAHFINLNDLKIAALGAGPGYNHHKGVLRLTGSNEINTVNYPGIESRDSGSILEINSLSSGTLTADGGNRNGIEAQHMIIGGNAKVTASSSSHESTTPGIQLRNYPTSTLTVAANAELTAGPKGGIESGLGVAISIECNGIIYISGIEGIKSSDDLNIWGSGTINISSTYVGISPRGSGLSIERTTVNVTCTGDWGIQGTGSVALSNGATLSVSGNREAVSHGLAGSIIMTPGTTLNMTVGTAGTGDTHPFTMSSPVNIWLIFGDMAFAGSDGPTTNPAAIALPAGKTGSVKLVSSASRPGITAPVPLILTEGYAAASTGAFTIAGSPAPTVTITSPDPKITWNNTTKKLDIATGLAVGSYPVELKAGNGYLPDATGTYTVTVNASGGGTVTVTSVSVNPSPTSVQKGTTKAFTATVNGSGGTPSQTVTWSVTGQADAATTINPTTGVLTVAAGETASTLTVKATSTADPTKSGTASVTVTVDVPGGEGGGGGNAILWVAIGVVIAAAAIGLLYFFVLKKKP